MLNSTESVIVIIVGLITVALTAASLLSALVIPRDHVGKLPHLVDFIVEGAFWLVVRSLKYTTRDRILAGEAACSILGLLITWLFCFTVGFALILWPVETNFITAMRESASSIYTLGYALRGSAMPVGIDFCAAVTGMITIALQVGYMPTLYAAFNRRETEITLLASRAGAPPTGVEILTRACIFSTLDSLPEFYLQWERWAADIAESHSSYPVLLHFRSPRAHASWLIALLAVLDSAALYESMAPEAAPIQARLTLRMGFTCFQQLAQTEGIEVDDDPDPNGDVHLGYEEFVAGYEKIASAGFAMERNVNDAWTHFRGWRVNYEKAAYELAWHLDVVPAPWSGPRRFGDDVVDPIRIKNRTPDAPQGFNLATRQANPIDEVES